MRAFSQFVLEWWGGLLDPGLGVNLTFLSYLLTHVLHSKHNTHTHTQVLSHSSMHTMSHVVSMHIPGHGVVHTALAAPARCAVHGWGSVFVLQYAQAVQCTVVIARSCI